MLLPEGEKRLRRLVQLAVLAEDPPQTLVEAVVPPTLFLVLEKSVVRSRLLKILPIFGDHSVIAVACLAILKGRSL